MFGHNLDDVACGLVPRVHSYVVHYTITMDSAGPFRYRILPPHNNIDYLQEQMKRYIGKENIKELDIELRSRHAAVKLWLKKDVFCHSSAILSTSPGEIKREIKALLDEKHLVSINIDDVIDGGGYGPYR